MDWTWRNFWDCTTWEFGWEGLVDKGIRLLGGSSGCRIWNLGLEIWDLGIRSKPTTRALQLLMDFFLTAWSWHLGSKPTTRATRLVMSKGSTRALQGLSIVYYSTLWDFCGFEIWYGTFVQPAATVSRNEGNKAATAERKRDNRTTGQQDGGKKGQQDTLKGNWTWESRIQKKEEDALRRRDTFTRCRV